MTFRRVALHSAEIPQLSSSSDALLFSTISPVIVPEAIADRTLESINSSDYQFLSVIQAFQKINCAVIS
jgi:hypothetical protein